MAFLVCVLVLFDCLVCLFLGFVDLCWWFVLVIRLRGCLGISLGFVVVIDFGFGIGGWVAWVVCFGLFCLMLCG